MTTALRRAVAIVGAAETDQLGTIPEMSEVGLQAQAARNALADAGMALQDVDGLLGTGAVNELAEYLGVTPRYIDTTTVGGCSYMIHVRHAVAAIAAGYCDVALIVHGQSGRSHVGVGGRGFAPQSVTMQYEAPFGTVGAPSTFALTALRHFHEFGTTKLQLAHVSAATREWAILNPMAMMHDAGPITPEDVMNSRKICYPFNLFDCCLVADGGGALVLVAAERARDFPKPPVYVLGAGEAVAHFVVSQMRDFGVGDSTLISGREAYTMAGLGPQDIDHLMFYDAFSFTPVMFLEDLGFVPKGRVGRSSRRHGRGRTAAPFTRPAPAGTCLSTPTAAASPTATPACTGCSRCWSPCSNCGARPGSGKCPISTPALRTGRAACLRPPAP